METNKLINEYKLEAEKYGECTEKGNIKNVNKAADNLYGIYQKLANASEVSKLKVLFDDPNKWVQLWAATDLLRSKDNSALKKLQELEKENIPHISADVKYIIMELNG